MAVVMRHHVPRGTCHVPPREPFEKCCVRAAAQTGSGREPKLSGQKRLCLNCVALGESAPRGQNCAPGSNFVFFSAILPSSSDTLGPRDPKFGTRVHVSEGYPNMHNLGSKKIRRSRFWILDFILDFFFEFCFFIIRLKMVKMTFLKMRNFELPNFLTPLTYTYFESPCCTVSLYQIS